MIARPLPILLYHAVSDAVDRRFERWAVTPAEFEAQMTALADAGYESLTVGELAAASAAGDALPERTVVITFDDGFADFHETACPILERAGLRATVFVTTGYVGRTSAWLGNLGEGDRRMMTWQQIVDVDARGMECGAHGHLHVPLDLSGATRAREEIHRSRRSLSSVVGSVASFAYPHGYSTARVRREVQRAGFGVACAVGDGAASPADDRYALTRAIVPRGTSPDRVLAIAEGGLPARPPRPVQRAAWRAVRRVGAEDVGARVYGAFARGPA